MFSYSRLYNITGSNACRPILIHPVLMSIVFEHYKQLENCEQEINSNIEHLEELEHMYMRKYPDINMWFDYLIDKLEQIKNQFLINTEEKKDSREK